MSYLSETNTGDSARVMHSLHVAARRREADEPLTAVPRTSRRVSENRTGRKLARWQQSDSYAAGNWRILRHAYRGV
jgi:hypothetical protein